MSEAVADQQTALLDLSGREFNQLWVDEKAPLFVANNPLHWKAHKIQIALARLEKISEKNPAQFNSTVYMATLDKLAELMDQINNIEKVAQANELLEQTTMAGGNTEPGGSEEIRQGEPDGLDSRISADNPFTRQRVSAS